MCSYCFNRRTLEQRFAVLLMRSAYNSVDELDFMPMVRLNGGRTSAASPPTLPNVLKPWKLRVQDDLLRRRQLGA